MNKGRSRRKMKKEKNIDILNLISQVEQKRCLYDTEHQWYRDPEKTYSVWGAIGVAMGFSGEECKSKWKITRDTYVKKKRQLKTRSGKAARRTAKWPYLQCMSFLDPFLQERESVSDLHAGDGWSSSERSEEDEEEDGEFGELSDHPEELDIADTVKQEIETEHDIVHRFQPRDMATVYLPTVKESGKRKQGYCVGQVTLGFLGSKKQKKQMKVVRVEKEEEEEKEKDARISRRQLPLQLDEDELFLMCQLPTLRRLPAAKKAAAKLKIHEILFHAEHTTPEIQ